MCSLISLCVGAIAKQGNRLPNLSFPYDILYAYDKFSRYDDMRKCIEQRKKCKLTKINNLFDKKTRMFQLLEFEIIPHYDMSKYDFDFIINRPYPLDIKNNTFIMYYEIGLGAFGIRASKDDMYQAYVYCENKWHCTGGRGTWFPL
ncbi:Hypothetical protein PACV_203 [Pacmanvirus A23]|uniref:Hypothetical protein n=1 Tax=Pacmanvirus A23 TaxID=1932881 RepID=UPI000A091EF4|nr:Hypothetical protein B9W72_gp201 [Pacmanvirus A23]SIP85918.1 Hypothetical protein PACV_203 [Pacmanvirus A23]